MITASRAINRLSGSLRVSLATDPEADRAAGIVSLFNGDPDFPTPAWICEAAVEAIRDGYTHYQPVQGDPELREAVAETLDERHGQDYTAEHILITNGATSAVYASIMSLVDPGDEVILLDPHYPLYEDAVRVANAVPVRARVRPDDFHLDLDAIERAITPRTRAIVFSSPCNPTGVLLSRAELQGLERLVVERDLTFISDEVYDHIVYDGRPFTSALDLPELAQRTVLLQSFSKTYAMTGWRVGFVAAKSGLSKIAVGLQRTSVGAVNSIGQRAALAALRASPQQADSWFREMLGVYDRRRRMGQALLDQMPRAHNRIPEATFYFWVKVDTSLSSVELIHYLREVGRLAIHSGAEYGAAGEGYIRLSYAAPDEEVREGITRLGEALARLER